MLCKFDLALFRDTLIILVCFGWKVDEYTTIIQLAKKKAENAIAPAVDMTRRLGSPLCAALMATREDLVAL